MPYLTRDGIKLFYDQAGSGPAMVFIHGWCCNRSYFAPQYEHFSQRHRAITVDLRGHGESDKPEGEYSMPIFADDVAWMLRELKVSSAVAIGHSMGGSVVGALAARHPGLVKGAIGVDTGIVATPRFQALVPAILEGLAGVDYLEASRKMVLGMFEAEDTPALCDRITREMTSAPQHVMLASMRANAAQTAENIGRIEQPTLLISAGRFPTDVAMLREFAPKLRYAQTVGSGHFNQLEVPEQVNAMIERFLAIEMADGW
jgi:pimeloyl-ACP methyl ester carboxylesterase